MPKIDLSRLPVRTGPIYPPPFDKAVIGRSSIGVGDAGGLTQFGANIATLAPGAKSAMLPWHATEDEFAYYGDFDLKVGSHASGASFTKRDSSPRDGQDQ